jgi:hypothetical protein
LAVPRYPICIAAASKAFAAQCSNSPNASARRLGLSADVPRGYTDLRVKFRVDSDPKYHNRLRELSKFSPVFNTIRQGANVEVQVEPK